MIKYDLTLQGCLLLLSTFGGKGLKFRITQKLHSFEARVGNSGCYENYWLEYLMSSYLVFCCYTFQEKGSTEIVFKAMGRAINKTVTMVELIKVFPGVIPFFFLFVGILCLFSDDY